MAKTRSILARQLEARKKIWPEITPEMLWDRRERDGFVTMPRSMPLILNIMDGLSEKGFPVSETYLEMWCRLYDELFLKLDKQEEMAFFAGFSGQRALRTWKDRVTRLADLGFINVKSGPTGALSYAVFLNPYHVIRRAFLRGDVSEHHYRALEIRANEIGATDLDDIDENGWLIVEEEVPPPPKPVTAVQPRRRIRPVAKAK